MLIENRFSNHHQLVNTIAYCQRFVHKLRCRNLFSSVVVPPTGKKIENLVPKLTAEEKENSEKFIIKSLQQFFFNTEKQALEKQVENETLFLPKTSHIRSLSPFLHEGIIRVGGRISEATQLTFEQKHPILLPHFISLNTNT
ncbi:CLUMA_CG006411, isoform A [Clunio marinus]|uniref:CLUMA_CG006411, isoform A n=1 Tax=Clunio marinus TaxID=568069 RepID=A0A1J1I2Z5_9DIPT|nr:CLUMA_CG006411, isoform A [Clunio marinus]